MSRRRKRDQPAGSAENPGVTSVTNDLPQHGSRILKSIVGGKPPLGFRLSGILVLLTVVVLAMTAVWRELERDSAADLLQHLPDLRLDEIRPLLADELSQRVQRVRDEPSSGAAWGALGMLLRGNHFATEADVCLSQAATLAPDDYRWPYLLGVSREPEDPTAAITLFQRALDCRDELFVRLRLAELLLKQQRLGEAAELLNTTHPRSLPDPRSQLCRAHLLMRRGDLVASLAWAERSAAAAPENRLPHLLLAELYHRLGQTEAANEQMRILEQRKHGVTVWPDPLVEQVLGLERSARSLADTGRRLLVQGELTAAIAALEAAVADEPRMAEYVVDLTSLLIQTGNLARAEQVLAMAASRHPLSAEIRQFRGVVAYRQRNWTAAAEIFREVIRDHPDFVMAHFNLGQCLEKQGFREEAVACFLRVVRLDPEFAEAQQRLIELRSVAEQNGARPDRSPAAGTPRTEK